MGAAEANARFVRMSDIRRHKMLRDARMAGSVKRHCGKGATDQPPLWAVPAAAVVTYPVAGRYAAAKGNPHSSK